MARRKIAVVVASLSIAAGAGLASGPVAVAGASSVHAQAHQHAACAAVAHGYARCLAHVVEVGTPQGHGPGPTATTPQGYAPVTVATAYGFATGGGATETIAIVDAYGAPTITGNLQSFSTTFGLPACTRTNGCFTKVNQSGGTSYPAATSGWALEQSLDVEWAHSLAPNARILLVEASTASFANLLTAVRYAASHGAKYVSMSWGGTDFLGETTYDSNFTASGVSYFAASGDTASSVLYPSSSPDVVSVGGTTLNVTGTTWKSETAWTTAGGGCSSYESANGAQSADSTPLCGTRRATPDISLDANPYTGVAVYDTERLSTGQSGWIQVGGTSAATVMVAAHATETAKALNATAVYGGTLKVYDVTSGSNGHACTVGYDLCTGVGSWNTAAGSSSGGSTGTLSFSPAGGVSVPAGSISAPIDVKLSKSVTAPLTVTVSTSTGGLATSPGATTFTSTVKVHVTANGTTSSSFYFESTKAGTHAVTASAANWTSASQSETVTASTLASISVSPASATVAKGATKTFTATGYDRYHNAVALTTVTWSASPTTLGSFSSSAPSTTFTAGTVGTGTITATVGAVHGMATVTVTAVAPLAATISAGRTSRHGTQYHTPLTVRVSAGGTAVSGATVQLTVYGGASCTTVKATGSGTTGAGGTVVFTYQTRSVATFCAVAVARYAGQSATTTTVTFTT